MPTLTITTTAATIIVNGIEVTGEWKIWTHNVTKMVVFKHFIRDTPEQKEIDFENLNKTG